MKIMTQLNAADGASSTQQTNDMVGAVRVRHCQKFMPPSSFFMSLTSNQPRAGYIYAMADDARLAYKL